MSSTNGSLNISANRLFLRAAHSPRGLGMGSGVRVLGSHPDSATGLETSGKRARLSEAQPPGCNVRAPLPSQDGAGGGEDPQRPCGPHACAKEGCRALYLLLSSTLFNLPFSHKHLLLSLFFFFFQHFDRAGRSPGLPVRMSWLCLIGHVREGERGKGESPVSEVGRPRPSSVTSKLGDPGQITLPP